jgi:hypothetical protein
METAETVGLSLREELESLVKLRLEELKSLATDIPRTDDGVFRKASSDFRSDVIAVSSYTPQADGSYALRFATNHSLIREKQLPPNSVFLMNQSTPLDVQRLARSRDVSILNRSFMTENGPVAVQTFIVYVKMLDGKSGEPILLADVLAESLNERLRRAEMVQSFLVSDDGALLAHPDPMMMLEFRDSVFPEFPQNMLPSDWRTGARFAWKAVEQDYLTAIVPTGLRGAYLTTQVPKAGFTRVLHELEREFWLGAGALLGLLAVFSYWLMSGVTRNIQNTAAAAQEMAKGAFDRVPKIRATDEFLYVRDSFKQLQTTLTARFREEFERGQRDSLLATTQTLRAAMGNPAAGSFERWEIVTHRPNDAASHQEFWDFHQKGNRRQVIVGRANSEGISGMMATLLARTTLDNIRRLADRFSTQRPPSLGELLDMVNGTLFAAFKGRVSIVANAFEVDLDSGALQWLHAGGPSAFRVGFSPQGLILDEHTYAGRNASLGAQAVSAYQATQGTLAPGERLIVHAPSILTKTSVSDVARDQIRKALSTTGRNSLAEMKTSLAESLKGNIFSQSLVFVALRRPGGEEASSALPTAARAA